jgi:hypothetical protein
MSILDRRGLPALVSSGMLQTDTTQDKIAMWFEQDALIRGVLVRLGDVAPLEVTINDTSWMFTGLSSEGWHLLLGEDTAHGSRTWMLLGLDAITQQDNNNSHAYLTFERRWPVDALGREEDDVAAGHVMSAFALVTLLGVVYNNQS